MEAFGGTLVELTTRDCLTVGRVLGFSSRAYWNGCEQQQPPEIVTIYW